MTIRSSFFAEPRAPGNCSSYSSSFTLEALRSTPEWLLWASAENARVHTRSGGAEPPAARLQERRLYRASAVTPILH